MDTTFLIGGGIIFILLIALFLEVYAAPAAFTYTDSLVLRVALNTLLNELWDKSGASGKVLDTQSGTSYYLRLGSVRSCVARVSKQRRVYAYLVPADDRAPIVYADLILSGVEFQDESVVAFIEELMLGEIPSRPATAGVVEDLVTRLSNDLRYVDPDWR